MNRRSDEPSGESVGNASRILYLGSHLDSEGDVTRETLDFFKGLYESAVQDLQDECQDLKIAQEYALWVEKTLDDLELRALLQGGAK